MGKMSRRALRHLKPRIARLGFKPGDLKETLKWIEQKAPIVIHFNLDTCGEHLARDAYYRNLFETHRGGGTVDTDMRAKWEDELFGGHYVHAVPHERCKYGALNVTNDPLGVRSCQQYGLCYLKLKGVRWRTTLSTGDSAGLTTDDLATAGWYAHALEGYTDDELSAVIEVGAGKTTFLSSCVLQEYKEAQIHGDVNLREDVVAVVAHPDIYVGKDAALKLLQRVAKHCNARLELIDQATVELVPRRLFSYADISERGRRLTAGSLEDEDMPVRVKGFNDALIATAPPTGMLYQPQLQLPLPLDAMR
eukprot:NODE_365_length_1631_cov_362.512690.p1 GENE.NODE_365_length_1631_cov_362.512690~~NODE_365_length_1631_cov_362.512690.p1  ORF type:complete len:307 (+),score=57.09 NODE_365_length_1631_cov_362.512690:3-923(+)